SSPALPPDVLDRLNPGEMGRIFQLTAHQGQLQGDDGVVEGGGATKKSLGTSAAKPVVLALGGEPYVVVHGATEVSGFSGATAHVFSARRFNGPFMNRIHTRLGADLVLRVNGTVLAESATDKALVADVRGVDKAKENSIIELRGGD